MDSIQLIPGLDQDKPVTISRSILTGSGLLRDSNIIMKLPTQEGIELPGRHWQEVDWFKRAYEGYQSNQ